MSSIRDEIATLRAQIAAQTRPGPAEDNIAAQPPAGDEPQQDSYDAETLLDTANALLDDFADELDRYPKLTAIAALGVGLGLGIFIGRQLR